MNLTEERIFNFTIENFQRLHTYNRTPRQLGAIAKFSIQTKFFTIHAVRICLARAGFLSIDWPSSSMSIGKKTERKTCETKYISPRFEYKLAIEKAIIDQIKPLLDKEILDYIGEDTSTEEPIHDEDFFED
jgi:hypothetical protein